MAAEVMYRRLGDSDWREGRTVNVSRTGVLFEASAPVLPAATRIEFILLLPSPGHRGRSRVRCQGQVVRQCLHHETRAIAASIDAYDFLGIAQETAGGRVVV